MVLKIPEKITNQYINNWELNVAQVEVDDLRKLRQNVTQVMTELICYIAAQ